jgi:hypothetical protein
MPMLELFSSSLSNFNDIDSEVKGHARYLTQ